MIKYKQIYLDAFGFYETDYIESELSENRAVHFHHISRRGMGGDPKKKKERIENLIALTYDEHIKYGDNKKFLSYLYSKHKEFMILKGVEFDENYIDAQIVKYLI